MFSEAIISDGSIRLPQEDTSVNNFLHFFQNRIPQRGDNTAFRCSCGSFHFRLLFSISNAGSTLVPSGIFSVISRQHPGEVQCFADYAIFAYFFQFQMHFFLPTCNFHLLFSGENRRKSTARLYPPTLELDLIGYFLTC